MQKNKSELRNIRTHNKNDTNIFGFKGSWKNIEGKTCAQYEVLIYYVKKSIIRTVGLPILVPKIISQLGKLFFPLSNTIWPSLGNSHFLGKIIEPD